MQFSFKNQKNYLILSGVLILLVVIGVYFFNLSANPAFVNIPDNLDKYTFENVYLQRITDAEDRALIKKLYVYSDNGEYELQKNLISSNDKHKVVEIVRKSGYFTDLETLDRNVDTIPKQILNGTFGVFFRFDLLGNLNWLAIPFFFAVLNSKKRFSRGEWFVISCYLAALIIISATSFPNYRYQFTLLPFSIGLVILALDNIINLKSISRYKLHIVGFLVFLVIINNLYFLIRYNRESSGVDRNPKEAMVDIAQQITLKGDEKVLVNNAPEFYYYTDLKGFYYSSGSDYYFVDGEKKLFNKKSFGEVNSLLESYNVKYILSDAEINEYFEPFKQFVNNCSEIVYDDNGYLLYKLKIDSKSDCN